MALSEPQRKANRRLGLILAAVALAFGVVFALKITFFGL
jgi:hypothetical protein